VSHSSKPKKKKHNKKCTSFHLLKPALIPNKISTIQYPNHIHHANIKNHQTPLSPPHLPPHPPTHPPTEPPKKKPENLTNTLPKYHPKSVPIQNTAPLSLMRTRSSSPTTPSKKTKTSQKSLIHRLQLHEPPHTNPNPPTDLEAQYPEEEEEAAPLQLSESFTERKTKSSFNCPPLVFPAAEEREKEGLDAELFRVFGEACLVYGI
jgi:hypothetical protein